MLEFANFNFKPEQITRAKDKLIELLQTLLNLATDEPTSVSPLEFPSTIVDDFQSRLKDSTLQREFKDLLSAIEEDKPVSKKYQRVLEDIITTLDSERRQFYRKLRARR